MKAIDTRIKEIKLAKTLEETSEITPVDLKDRKKDKKLINNRNKRKIEKFKDFPQREKTKRKLKDEFLELQKVENKFFEIVKLVISK